VKMSSNKISEEAAQAAARLARDERLRIEFRRNLDVQCSRMVEHLHGLVKASRIDTTLGDQSGSAATELSAAAEQERLRRDGFHVSYHAESLVVAGDALLSQIHDLRLNLVLATPQIKVDENNNRVNDPSSSSSSSAVADDATRSSTSASTEVQALVEDVVDKKRKALEDAR